MLLPNQSPKPLFTKGPHMKLRIVRSALSISNPRALSAALFGLLLPGLPGNTAAQPYARPTYSSPVAISRNDKLIWSVNPGANTVSVIRPDSNALITNIPVGTEPQ